LKKIFKLDIKNAISKILDGFEVYISIIIIFGIFILSFDVLKELYFIIIQILGGNTIKSFYKEFFNYSLQLIIGIEFIKMLLKHTPDSAIEVLVFVTARRLIVDEHFTSIDILFVVIALAVLFGIKKYLNTKYKDITE
jgi:hypothetical protein